MGQHVLPWTAVLKHMYPQFKNKRLLSYLIETYKNGDGDMYQSPYTDAPAAAKRKCNGITPTKADNSVTTSSTDNPKNFAPSKLFTDSAGLQYRMTPVVQQRNEPTRHGNQDGFGSDRVALNHNDEPGNYLKTNKETEYLLTPTRRVQWICADGDTVFDNPRKVLHSMLNWFDVITSKEDLKAIPQIKNLYDPDELVGSFKKFCLSEQINLERGTKTFEELFTCEDPEFTPILIVVAAQLHNFENNNVGYPNSAFTQLMLLYQTGPQFVLTGSTTNMNLYLGTMIRDKDYRIHDTFEKYMLHNVNNKLVPIHRDENKTGSLLRKLHFHSYYTTKIRQETR